MNTLGHRSWGQCSLPDTLGCVGGEIASITAVCLTGQVHSRHSGAKFQSLSRSAKTPRCLASFQAAPCLRPIPASTATWPELSRSSLFFPPGAGYVVLVC